MSSDKAPVHAEEDRYLTLLEAMLNIARITNHQTFTCASGQYDSTCPKCIALAALYDPEDQQ